jgi:hypothetical protein
VILHQQRRRPESWEKVRGGVRAGWLTPFYALDWLFDWLAHFLSRWVLLEVLEYLGTFSVLIAVVFYFSESGDRIKQKHYQAWQVINTAQGKGGSGGRIEAVQELNEDRVPLVGIDLSDAFLRGIQLNHAQISRSNLASADLRESSLRSASLAYANLNTANMRASDLRATILNHADLTDADVFGANLAGADLTGAHLDRTDLRYANLQGVKWRGAASIKLANLFGVKGAPEGFVEWARSNGAVDIESDERWNAALEGFGARR